MHVEHVSPPRKFQVGLDEKKITLSDCGRVTLDSDEQVTFVTEDAKEYDVARKSWGYYATPSLNDRLLRFNLVPVLVKNRLGKFFLLLFEKEKENEFYEYIENDKLEVVVRFDKNESTNKLLDI